MGAGVLLGAMLAAQYHSFRGKIQIQHHNTEARL